MKIIDIDGEYEMAISAIITDIARYMVSMIEQTVLVLSKIMNENKWI